MWPQSDGVPRSNSVPVAGGNLGEDGVHELGAAPADAWFGGACGDRDRGDGHGLAALCCHEAAVGVGEAKWSFRPTLPRVLSRARPGPAAQVTTKPSAAPPEEEPVKRVSTVRIRSGARGGPRWNGDSYLHPTHNRPGRGVAPAAWRPNGRVMRSHRLAGRWGGPGGSWRSNRNDVWIAGPVPSAMTNVPNPTEPPSDQPTRSATTSMAKREGPIGRPRR